MLYKDELTDELFHSFDSPDCVVLACAIDVLYYSDSDFNQVSWLDNQGYYRDRLVVTRLEEDE